MSTALYKESLPNMRLSLLCAATLSAGIPAVAAPVYVALGDSITFGETDLFYVPSDGDRGYVSLFDQYLGARTGVTPGVVNLAIDGETSTSFVTNAGRTPPVVGRTDVPLQVENINYDPAALVSQEARFAQVAAAEKAAGNTISDITITLGFNDLAALASLTPAAALAAIPMTLAKFSAAYAQDLTEIGNLAPSAHIFLLGYYNPFPADPTSPAAPIFDTAGKTLNSDIQSIAAQFSATYVDTAPAFVGNEAAYTYLATQPAGSSVAGPYGGVLAIGNVHPNAAGYSAIAQEIEPAAVVEPATWTMMIFGTAMLGAVARGRRRLAPSTSAGCRSRQRR